MIAIKKCGILLLATLITAGCNSQENKNKEETDNKQEVSADAPKGSWKVNREFDEEGNLIRYDSIYSWSSGDDLDRLSSLDRDSTLQAMQSKFYRNFSSFGNQGFDDVFPDFKSWLTERTGAQVHGHLFAKDRVHFADESRIYRGGLSDHPRLRDYNAKMFLTNLIWNGREDQHCFQFGPADSQEVQWTLAKDTNASIWVISGAWSIPLYRSGRSASEVRAEAARLQRIESKFLKTLRGPHAHARIKIMTLAEFIETPMDVLQTIIDDIAAVRLRRQPVGCGQDDGANQLLLVEPCGTKLPRQLLH